MTGFRAGDVVFEHNGTGYHLRLSLGAIAAIEERLHIRGPLALAKLFRELGDNPNRAQIAHALLECLLLPAPPSIEAGASTRTKSAKPSAPPMDVFLPNIARLFERALNPQTS